MDWVTSVVDCTLGVLVELGIKKVKQGKEEQALKATLSEYTARYFEEKFNGLIPGQDFDFQGLRDATPELVREIKIYHTTMNFNKKGIIRNDIYAKAYNLAKATKEVQKEQVAIYVDFIFFVVDIYFDKQLDATDKYALSKIVSQIIEAINCEKSSKQTANIHNLPYVKNPYFTGRDAMLQQIHVDFESGDAISLTQTIKGLGGLGKTQVALQYAYKYKQDYKLIWWVTAETTAMVVAAYREFAKRMQLLNVSQQYSSNVIVQAVTQWLDTNSGWLFIFDNVETLSSKTSWLPRNGEGGHILITTRNRQGIIGKKVDISVFSQEDAVLFLEKRTKIKNARKTARVLAERLGCLPLALEQAAAYIVNTGMSFEEYLAILDEYGLEVLEEIDGVLDYEKPLTATWQISISKIADEGARQLLYLCAYFAPENITMDIFVRCAELLPEPLRQQVVHKLKLNKLVIELTSYSLLEKQRDGQGYSMHRLLQEVVRQSIQDDMQWATCCLDMFYEDYAFEYGNVASHKKFIQDTPHVEAFLSVGHQDDREKWQIKLSDIYSVAGMGNYHQGKYEEALSLHEKALKVREKVLGKEHPDTATSYNNIAWIYASQGKYEEALSLHEKALEVREKVLGKEHPDTATSYNNIAWIYNRQGKYEEALSLHEKALEVREKVLGKEHPDTATSYNNIAGVYKSQGKYEEALSWYEKVLRVKEKVLGKEHPDTATSYNNIAVLYYSQGKHEEALSLHEKALKVREKVLGKEHPDTAMSYNNIAGVYNRLGKYEEALSWYEKALKVNEKVLGKEHPDTATIYNNIAGIYDDSQGKYEEALSWYEKALEVREKVLGKEHPDTATIYNNIAVVYYDQGDYRAALELLNKALTIMVKFFSDQHPYVVSLQNSIQIVKDQLNQTN